MTIDRQTNGLPVLNDGKTVSGQASVSRRAVADNDQIEQDLQRIDELKAISEHILDDAQNGVVEQTKEKRICVGYTIRTASNQIYVGAPEQVVAKRFIKCHREQYNEFYEDRWVGASKVEVMTNDYAKIRGWEEISIQRAGEPFRYSGSSANERSGIDWRLMDHTDPVRRRKYKRYMAAGRELLEQNERERATRRQANEASEQDLTNARTQSIGNTWAEKAPSLPTLALQSNDYYVVDKD